MKIVVVDTTQIQPYIFGSNRMRENIGASYLVAQATGSWALKEIHNILDFASSQLDPSVTIGQGDVKAQVLYTGGGNVVIVFADDKQTDEFIRNFSRRVLQDAPDLQIVIATGEFQRGESLALAVKATLEQLRQKKQAREFSAPLLGLGVTVMCRSTRMPAVAKTRPTVKNEPETAYEASAEIHAKLDAAWPRGESGKDPSLADEALQRFLDLDEAYASPREFDELGREAGVDSHIAIVHADGNGVGNLFKQVAEKYARPDQNQKYIQHVYELSEQVKTASREALRAVGRRLVDRMKRDGGNAIRHYNRSGTLLADVVLRQRDGKQLVPFRPLVFGGDDLTFVCDGRLGLALTIAYLKEFEKQTENWVGKKLTACAGIAVVKTRYPFAVAYQLANDLCESAKRYRQQAKLEDSCLDWHFALSDVSEKIEKIRGREYTSAQGGHLHLRPVALTGGEGTGDEYKAYRRWEIVQKGIDEFQDVYNDKAEWSTKRNKVKALREALRQGETAVQRFCTQYRLTLPRLPYVNNPDHPQTGWQDKHCLYFDAIELMDWFIPLDPLPGDSDEEQRSDG
ncbi:MAG: hypothetical protein Fur0021_24100 [Candidatus Promineifilaceae bacterium]